MLQFYRLEIFVEEFNYTTLSIVFLTCSNGRGRTHIGFSLLDRKIRVSFDLEYLGRRTRYCEKIAVQKFTIEFYAGLIFLSAAVRRSATRGPKSKNFSPNFSKTCGPIIVIFVQWIGLTEWTKTLESSSASFWDLVVGRPSRVVTLKKLLYKVNKWILI